ncbi:MAG: MotA/TolQ/ExbB proton channel family protein [Campylobacterota bacterium]|nr:MotA/TolQ/ExbB proton channel family protein [Campylobacterota bacterium]
MKKLNIIVIALIVLFTNIVADELSDAYKKEYTFLKAQKSELKNRLEKEKKLSSKEITKGKNKVEALQNRYVALSETLKNQQLKIEESSKILEDKNSNKDMLSNVIMQAKLSLEEYSINVDDSSKTTQEDALKKAFSDASILYKRLSSIDISTGKYYLADGTTAKGEIVKVGNIAAYGVSTKGSGALSPAGNGEYKLWNKPSSQDAKSMLSGNMNKDINIFVYENLDKDVEYEKEKTIEETLEGGGTIGYIILALGALGLLLLLLRVIFLTKASSNVNKITNIVIEKVESGKGEETLEAVKEFEGSTARVIKATLRSIDKDREHVEDIVMESILNESTALDRFGNFILVLAAVAPLLGLLGTVTGMIATFDIITTHGTGDPKLLSGGISEALVTTMLGLVVAIPLLLLGNLMGGWAQNIKDSMEQSALHIVNLFEKNRA